MRKIVALTSLLLAISTHAAPPERFGKVAHTVAEVSLVSLIANPEKYDGKPIRAIGALRLEFEGQALCLHEEDQVHRNAANCFWIKPDLQALGTDTMTLSSLSGQYVLLEGTFQKDEHGHKGRYPGAIVGIWRIDSWPGHMAKTK
jgi:hypothetical protein